LSYGRIACQPEQVRHRHRRRPGMRRRRAPESRHPAHEPR